VCGAAPAIGARSIEASDEQLASEFDNRHLVDPVGLGERPPEPPARLEAQSTPGRPAQDGTVAGSTKRRLIVHGRSGGERAVGISSICLLPRLSIARRLVEIVHGRRAPMVSVDATLRLL
jgi:hypothetical protein